MLDCYVMFIYILLFTPSYGQQLTCEGTFSVPRYASGDRFITAIGDKSYDCGCLGEECQQITCIVLEAAINETETVETCRDTTTGRTYARGTTFVRYEEDGVNLACTCAATGPLKITCKQPQCVIPPPPPPTRSHLRKEGFCYDQHTDNWHQHDVWYTRKVVMSYAPDIIGQYKCICNPLSIRCSAIEMPCCDTRTGKFVPKNQRFVTTIEGQLPMSCVCLGGRGRVGQCERLHDRREVGQSQRVRSRRCLDTATNRYYREGTSFIQMRRTGERMCRCTRQKRRLKILCKRRE